MKKIFYILKESTDPHQIGGSSRRFNLLQKNTIETGVSPIGMSKAKSLILFPTLII
jgi:hypothetical protein